MQARRRWKAVEVAGAVGGGSGAGRLVAVWVAGGRGRARVGRGGEGEGEGWRGWRGRPCEGGPGSDCTLSLPREDYFVVEGESPASQAPRLLRISLWFLPSTSSLLIRVWRFLEKNSRLFLPITAGKSIIIATGENGGATVSCWLPCRDDRLAGCGVAGCCGAAWPSAGQLWRGRVAWPGSGATNVSENGFCGQTLLLLFCCQSIIACNAPQQ